MLEWIPLQGPDWDIYGLPEKTGEEKKGAVNALDSNGNAVSTEAIGSQEASVTANITIQPRWQESCFK